MFLQEVTDEHVVRVVIGNKVDLEDLRQVQKKRGEEIADVSMKGLEELNAFVSDVHGCDENYKMGLQGPIFASQEGIILPSKFTPSLFSIFNSTCLLCLRNNIVV